MKSNDAVLKKWLGKMPGAKSLPFEINRRSLYSVPELYRGYVLDKPDTWKASFDRRVYEWTLKKPLSAGTPTGEARKLNAAETIAERLHDTSIGEAIARFTMRANKRVIGFMGGHDTSRADAAFEQTAQIARKLRNNGFTIVTGGGPGLMEAANFGAFMAPYNDQQFSDALKTLAASPNASDSLAWVQSAATVRQTLLGKWNTAAKDSTGWSLGIPTWYYGNEPPNLFASHSGKYFFNSVREDGLVTIADGGLMFAPGSAGTVQEVFQDACINFYRKAVVPPTPMVMLGVEFWNPVEKAPILQKPGEHKPLPKPAYPLLDWLSQQGNSFKKVLTLTDDPGAAFRALSVGGSDRPKTYKVENAGNALKGRAIASL